MNTLESRNKVKANVFVEIVAARFAGHWCNQQSCSRILWRQNVLEQLSESL